MQIKNLIDKIDIQMNFKLVEINQMKDDKIIVTYNKSIHLILSKPFG
jgi:hypothetical protein